MWYVVSTRLTGTRTKQNIPNKCKSVNRIFIYTEAVSEASFGKALCIHVTAFAKW